MVQRAIQDSGGDHDIAEYLPPQAPTLSTPELAAWVHYLSYLARTSRLGAVKIGSEWMTTREALEEYGDRIAKQTD